MTDSNIRLQNRVKKYRTKFNLFVKEIIDDPDLHPIVIDALLADFESTLTSHLIVRLPPSEPRFEELDYEDSEL